MTPRIRYTAAQVEFIIKHFNKRSTKSIAKHCGVSEYAITNKVKALRKAGIEVTRAMAIYPVGAERTSTQGDLTKTVRKCEDGKWRYVKGSVKKGASTKIKTTVGQHTSPPEIIEPAAKEVPLRPIDRHNHHERELAKSGKQKVINHGNPETFVVKSDKSDWKYQYDPVKRAHFLRPQQ